MSSQMSSQSSQNVLPNVLPNRNGRTNPPIWEDTSNPDGPNLPKICNHYSQRGWNGPLFEFFVTLHGVYPYFENF